ncbi:NUDIX hydrolase [Psychrobacillus vulpis]|uniref:NUDIX hydrolase n=1 Tax=Psychrobacillus vulpis TaxID=2325572 RepID=A0A544TVV6_9BACI|nr:NUDIX hydrolase [Psychrobacillus vulpis]TQR21588.1 NUDIX hydrolase [Psychrobacillus vulpis]
MFKWQGAAGICMNEKKEVLMVLQAAPGEEKKWTVPSGTMEDGETFEQCCIREFYEETGFTVRIVDKVQNKNGVISEYGISYYVEYFLVEIESGEIKIQDPDEFIHEIAWKPIEELSELSLAYPEDVEIIQTVFSSK